MEEAEEEKRNGIIQLESYRNGDVVPMVTPPLHVSFALVGQEILRHVHNAVVSSGLVFYPNSVRG